MISREILTLRCPCCDELLDDFELSPENYRRLGGMKEKCYEISIGAANDDGWDQVDEEPQ